MCAKIGNLLNDVDEEKKEHILCHYSEKLVITLRPINTSSWTTLYYQELSCMCWLPFCH